MLRASAANRVEKAKTRIDVQRQYAEEYAERLKIQEEGENSGNSGNSNEAVDGDHEGIAEKRQIDHEFKADWSKNNGYSSRVVFVAGKKIRCRFCWCGYVVGSVIF